MANSYFTITHQTEGIYKEKGSKFIAHALPVQSIEEVQGHLKELRKRYFDARHVCYAYMLGREYTEFRANDDGEPSGTAGRPILGQINSRNLTNVLVVVVRYFGGILLGTGGLIVAYRESAHMALEAATVVEKAILQSYHLTFEYPLMNDIMRIVKEESATTVSALYENSCKLTVEVCRANNDRFLSKLKQIHACGVTAAE